MVIPFGIIHYGGPVAPNPFRYGAPVSGPNFTGRSGEVAILSGIITARGEVALVTAPRGFGKTSVAFEVADRLSAAGHRVVCADALRGVELGEVLDRIEPAGTGRATLLVLDELQAMSGSSNGLAGELVDLRRRRPQVSVLMVGVAGRPTTGALGDAAASLTGRCAHLRLGAIPKRIMVDFLRVRAEAGGKSMGTVVAELLIDLGRNVPQHVQRLAHASFERARGQITERTVEEAVHDVVAQDSTHYAERLRALAPGHRRVLAVLREGPLAHPRSAAFTRATGYANPAAAHKSLRTLEEHGLLAHDGQAFEIADPFLARWLGDAERQT